MLDKLGSAYLRSKIWLKCKVEDFKEEEKGVSGIVATVILVLVAVLLAIAFKNQVGEFVKGLWDSIKGKKDTLTAPISE